MDDILKEAKKKALSLLGDMDRTEEELILKLKQKGYSTEIAEQAVEYVKSFGYINDVNYAERFIESRQKTKSRQEIYSVLCQKGIERTVVEQAMDKCYEHYDEVETIRNLVIKRKFSLESSTEAEKKKIFAYLLRKGFRNEDVRQVIQVSLWNA